MSEQYLPEGLSPEVEAVLAESTGGYDPELAAKTIYQSLVGLEKMTRLYNEQADHWLKDKKSRKDFKPDTVSRAVSNMAKCLNEIVRLAAFASGKPDARPDASSGWLQALTKEQFDQVQKWAFENLDRVNQSQADKSDSRD